MQENETRNSDIETRISKTYSHSIFHLKKVALLLFLPHHRKTQRKINEVSGPVFSRLRIFTNQLLGYFLKWIEIICHYRITRIYLHITCSHSKSYFIISSYQPFFNVIFVVVRGGLKKMAFYGKLIWWYLDVLRK